MKTEAGWSQGTPGASGNCQGQQGPCPGACRGARPAHTFMVSLLAQGGYLLQQSRKPGEACVPEFGHESHQEACKEGLEGTEDGWPHPSFTAH